MSDILQTLIVAGIVAAALLYIASLGKAKDCGESGCGCKGAVHDPKAPEADKAAPKQP